MLMALESDHSSSESTRSTHSFFAASISVSDIFEAWAPAAPSPVTLACFLERKFNFVMAPVKYVHTEPPWAYMWVDEALSSLHGFSYQNPWSVWGGHGISACRLWQWKGRQHVPQWPIHQNYFRSERRVMSESEFRNKNLPPSAQKRLWPLKVRRSPKTRDESHHRLLCSWTKPCWQ